AMPRTWSPPTMPDSPTTGADVARSTSRTPGTPRIGPTDTIGLDGGTITRSASVIASMTPGAGLLVSSPITTTSEAGTSAWKRIQYSWKCTAHTPTSGYVVTPRH